MFRSVRSTVIDLALTAGLVLMALIVFGRVDQPRYAFDLGFRCLRFGAAAYMFGQ